MSGCKGPEHREAAQSHNWSGHQHYMKGVHVPVLFIFWHFNDIADQSTFKLAWSSRRRGAGGKSDDPRWSPPINVGGS
eukprot:5850297-Pyramimonas_sp.AAC.1